MSTFLEQLRAAREAATPEQKAGKWKINLYNDAEQALILLLVNNAEKIERLIETIHSTGHIGELTQHPGCEICQALAALDGEADG